MAGGQARNTLEQKALLPRHQHTPRAGFPGRCKAPSPQPGSAGLGHADRTGHRSPAGREPPWLPTPGSLLPKPVLAWLRFVPRQELGLEQDLAVLILSVTRARLSSWCSVSGRALCQVSLQHRSPSPRCDTLLGLFQRDLYVSGPLWAGPFLTPATLARVPGGSPGPCPALQRCNWEMLHLQTRRSHIYPKKPQSRQNPHTTRTLQH